LPDVIDLPLVNVDVGFQGFVHRIRPVALQSRGNPSNSCRVRGSTGTVVVSPATYSLVTREIRCDAIRWGCILAGSDKARFAA